MMIKIKRDSVYADSGRAYKVVLDGNVVGKVKDGQQIEVDVSQGKHELFLKIDWCRSNAVEFESDGSSDIEFECGSNLRGLKSLLWIVYETFLRNKYIWLKIHKSEEFQRKEEERRRQEKRRKSEEERRRAEEQNRRHSQSNFNENTVRDESYYASVLGFQGRVMSEDVKRQYKKLAAQYHPDKVDHLGQKLKEVAKKEMKEINEAYEFFKKKYGLK